MTANTATAKDRSYTFRPLVGSAAKLARTEKFAGGARFPAGTDVIVLSVSNGGFRGIEARVRVAGTHFTRTVSTGDLTGTR